MLELLAWAVELHWMPVLQQASGPAKKERGTLLRYSSYHFYPGPSCLKIELA